MHLSTKSILRETYKSCSKFKTTPYLTFIDYIAALMGRKGLLSPLLIAMVVLSFALVKSEDSYTFYTWVVTYGIAYPMNVPQTVILINGQFPGPRLEAVTNDNLIINVINKLDEPFLITWNGIKQRKNSWQDGMLGTNCPIPPNANFTYKFQTKDQIGTFFYFPSTLTHRFAGGFGGLNVYARSVIPVPYPKPAQDFTVLIGDWYKTSNKALRQIMDFGKSLPFPDGILINGRTQVTFSGDQGKTYIFRISNVGFSNSLNFRIQGHKMKIVEVEGSHVMQNMYDSLDLHVGQSMSVLVTLDQPPKDYYIVVLSRFTEIELTSVAMLHYTNSQSSASGPVPSEPPTQIEWSINQARSLRWNLTANAARPNPQGSFHYGQIPITRTFVFDGSALIINGKQRYAVNRVSYMNAETPLKLADHFNIAGVFRTDAIQSVPSERSAFISTSVVSVNFHDFIEVVFLNNENFMQSWHLDGYDFWVVGYGSGMWTNVSRKTYNLVDALTRHTAPVFPNSWTAILVSLDNLGMWNMRSALWERQYLGQQFYLRVYDSVKSLANEYYPPTNVLLCGKAIGRQP